MYVFICAGERGPFGAGGGGARVLFSLCVWDRIVDGWGELDRDGLGDGLLPRARYGSERCTPSCPMSGICLHQVNNLCYTKTVAM